MLLHTCIKSCVPKFPILYYLIELRTKDKSDECGLGTVPSCVLAYMTCGSFGIKNLHGELHLPRRSARLLTWRTAEEIDATAVAAPVVAPATAVVTAAMVEETAPTAVLAAAAAVDEGSAVMRVVALPPIRPIPVDEG